MIPTVAGDDYVITRRLFGQKWQVVVENGTQNHRTIVPAPLGIESNTINYHTDKQSL